MYMFHTEDKTVINLIICEPVAVVLFQCFHHLPQPLITWYLHFFHMSYRGHTAMNKKKPPKILIIYQFSRIQTHLFICNIRFSHWCFQDLSARMLCNVDIPTFKRINFSVKQSRKISTADGADHPQDFILQNLFLKYSISYYPSTYTKFCQIKSL